MIATISKCFTFDAAHRLDRLPADHKCHRMHGHTYEVELVFRGPVDDMGFVLDYADIATAWAPLHDLLDHRVLNEVPGLETPTTEVLAAWIAVHIASSPTGSADFGALLEHVLVRESSTTWCRMELRHIPVTAWPALLGASRA